MTAKRQQAAAWIARLHAAAKRLPRPVAFMEVCGTHTVNAFRAGLHALMPDNVRLLSGPGCPVCVTSQGDIDLLIELGTRTDVTLCTYGDMLRVTGARGSLELARSRGADVRVVYSAMDAVKLAAATPSREVVFAAVGFETTAPATAAAVLAAAKLNLRNFSVLASHKLIMPAMHVLMRGRAKGATPPSDAALIDGFLCPGHVSIVLGSEAFRPVVDTYAVPCVIGGFEDVQIAAALARLTELFADGTPELENQYAQAVSATGNPVAQQMLNTVFEPANVAWRALGVIPGSGLTLRPAYHAFDAARRFALTSAEAPEPRGCRCGEVITGRCSPDQCKLFGTACTPIDPVGPCMVSSEGVCAAWFKYGRNRIPRKPAQPVEVHA